MIFFKKTRARIEDEDERDRAARTIAGANKIVFTCMGIFFNIKAQYAGYQELCSSTGGLFIEFSKADVDQVHAIPYVDKVFFI